jgi:glutaredoxin
VNEPEVTLYGRPGCHLCAVAVHQLRALQRSIPFRLLEVNIEGDEELERRYLLEIPVVAVNGTDVTTAPVDIEVVRQALLAVIRPR